ncbi:ankyrin [Patellaria atrata CBS 101060]|uniref:Ankyrin n=1 Tax=Patellaria atrata CBS 101060 TaxID=1346257 RepID=A0A9P4SAP8_9PEZI|nr:ankyrin [Patellaria atrata CBS 101060]
MPSNDSEKITPLPPVPAKHKDFISYLSSHPDTPMTELLEPYKQFDTKLRELFAQEPNHPALSDPHINTLSLYVGYESEIKIRARNIDVDTQAEKGKYIMPLKQKDRKPNGVPAIIESFKEFQTNFNLFSESSLVDMDWSNVVAAGSSVVTPLIPVPEKYRESKRSLRQYYHEIVAPASDVDLFLYGLTEEEAIEKIKQIETRVKDSILQETTTVRTKHAITIASQYPVRHVQIVLRIYKSVSEILTGFDVDCSGAAYDGEQVYVSPRALASYITQVNPIDLTRRSPSYENRLAKYSQRGFEIYWPHLDRSRIDPTIFERSFSRTVGLARLLVLEKLPTSSEREAYMDKRRMERGRPVINRFSRYSRNLRGNIKDAHELEVADWLDQEDVSDYHTFTIPYGEKFHARKIEKLLYTKDLLLNAEWNKPKDREVYLHRHPAFFGNVEDVIHDCCLFCPSPVTDEEKEVAEQESKIYVSGEVYFLKDDPGRQSIGSFNPITDDDWTEMSYVGNTARLCQSIVDGDLEHVQAWLASENADPNRRDYTGRTPLHLAVICGASLEIVQALINAGARLIARLADGRTSLHLASARGDVAIVKAILEKSEENEEAEAVKEDLRKKAKTESEKGNATADETEESKTAGVKEGKEDDSEDDGELVGSDEDDEDGDAESMATGSFVKVRNESKSQNDNLPDDNDEDEPDVFDVNVLAWDNPLSPLHLAIINGHIDVVKELVSTFGADVLLPVKLLNSHDKSPRAAILTLALALQLPIERAKEMARTLLELGASSAQADMHQTTALHYYAATSAEALDVLFAHDEPAAKRVLNHLSVGGSQYSPVLVSPLVSAIQCRNTLAALKLLEAGASTTIDFDSFIKSFDAQFKDRYRNNPDQNKNTFKREVEQPIVTALDADLTDIVLELLNQGVDPNTLNRQGQRALLDGGGYNSGETLLDIVQSKLHKLKEYKGERLCSFKPFELEDDEHYLQGLTDGTYKYCVARRDLEAAKRSYERDIKYYEKEIKDVESREGVTEKKNAISELIGELETLESILLAKGAKPFSELHPENIGNHYPDRPYRDYRTKPVRHYTDFSFNVSDLTDTRKEGYLELFEAAWSGDLQKIKSLTLTLWGPNNDQSPLQIAVKDRWGSSPFSITMLRGHTDVAKAILEISDAQYQQPEPAGRERFDMRSDADDDSDASSSASDEIPIYSEIIDDQFTIENIGEVATQVKSTITPLEMLSWGLGVLANDPSVCPPVKPFYLGQKSLGGRAPGSQGGTFGTRPTQPDYNHSVWYKRRPASNLLELAIEKDDMELLILLLELGSTYTARQSTDDADASRIYSISSSVFTFAMNVGSTRSLAEIIKRTGAGMPIQDLVKKSGIEIHEKPKYYQGLSVHGKKRADWAAAGRGMQAESTVETHPPPLECALNGSLETLEWFLSDSPLRRYSEFAKAHEDDKRVKNLAKSSNDLEQIIYSWLETRIDLSVHCVVMSQPSMESIERLKYIIKAVPTSLNAKSIAGLTPLQIAFSIGRYSYAKVLIDAGANQSCRDYEGNNLVHRLLSRGTDLGAESVSRMLSLIDPSLLVSMFTERNSPGSLTPLAYWLDISNSALNYYDQNQAWNNDTDTKVQILRAVLESSKGIELDLINGAGDTPVHQAISFRAPRLLRTMLESRPETLHRESATGRTPLEVAEDEIIKERTANPPFIGMEQHGPTRHYYAQSRDLVNKRPEDFIKEKDKTTERAKVLETAQEFAKRHPEKRKLVTLFEANEVAKRLASGGTSSGRTGYRGGRHRQWRRKVRKMTDGEDLLDEEVEEEKKDEVEDWLAGAMMDWKREMIVWRIMNGEEVEEEEEMQE